MLLVQTLLHVMEHNENVSVCLPREIQRQFRAVEDREYWKAVKYGPVVLEESEVT